MVTYIPAGRLGNALFQCAMVIQYALRHGLEYHIPSKTNDPYWNAIYFPHLRNPRYVSSRPRVVIQEVGHAFQKVPYHESWRNSNIVFNGYWQTEKYFADYRDRLIELFGAPTVNRYGVASIHIRLGDYRLYPDKHPVVSNDFYDAAIKMIVDRYGITKFRVFSDEPRVAREIISSRLYVGLDFEFISGNNELTDLMMIAECEHHINSSSTFSWWGAWLNPNKDKMVITPRDWFVPGHGGLDTSDIIPQTWIKL